MRKKTKKIVWVITFVLVLAAIAWAVAELTGQANAAAADAGDSSLEMEEITMEMIKEPKPKNNPPPCDWQKEKGLRKDIEANNAAYKKMIAKAKSESLSGEKTSAGTAKAIKASAADYKKLQLEYAAMWDACNCKTRSKLAHELAETRIKNADVVAGGVDEEKIAALETQQKKLNDTRHEYAEQANRDGEIAPEDKKAMKAALAPRVQNLMGNVGELMKTVTSLMTNIQQTATKATKGGAFGAFSAVSSLASGGSGLLGPVKSLMSMVKSMSANTESLDADVQLLSS